MYMLKSSPQSCPSRIVTRWKAVTRTTQSAPRERPAIRRSAPFVEPPARPVVARQRLLGEQRAHHLDGHAAALQDGVVELPVGHLLRVHELVMQRAEL